MVTIDDTPHYTHATATDDVAVEEKRVVDERGNGKISSSRFSYGIRMLEELRFVVNVENQKRQWDGILKGLEQAVIEEYKGLYALNLDNNKNKTAVSCWKDNYKLQKKKEKEVLVPSDMALKLTVSGETFLDGARQGLYVIDSCELSFSNNFDENSMIHDKTCEEDEDSDEEYDSIQRVAFLVEGEPDFDSGPPQDGLEFLRHVRCLNCLLRWEAAHIPKEKVVKPDKTKSKEQTPYMPNIPDVPKCPDNLLPLKQWEDNFLAGFSDLRQKFSYLENSKDESLAAPVSKPIKGINFYLQLLKNQPPNVSILLATEPVSRASLLRKLISEFKNATTLSRDNCVWIFSLCVSLDVPLDAETSATMRSLLRKCSSLLVLKVEQDDEVAMLNVLVAISGKYFHQSEREFNG